MEQELFVRTRSPLWEKMEILTGRMRKGGAQNIPPEDLMAFAGLYRKACADLAFARSRHYDAQLLKYLNGCVGRAYAELYREEPFTFRQVMGFYLSDFPALVRHHFRLILLAFCVFMAGGLFSFIMVFNHPECASSFVEESMLEGSERDGGDRTAGLSLQQMSMISHQIMTNNISVGIKAFATGIFLGFGTAWILLSNGALLGALAAWYMLHGGSLQFWSLILPHGVIELCAIFICGGAGFLLARWLIDPGDREPMEALRAYGMQAVRLMVGVVLLFVVAAGIEGFFTPLPIAPLYKVLFSALMTWALFFYFVRRKTGNRKSQRFLESGTEAQCLTGRRKGK